MSIRIARQRRRSYIHDITSLSTTRSVLAKGWPYTVCKDWGDVWGASRGCEHVTGACFQSSTPRTKILIKARGAIEHGIHVLHTCRVPAIEGLIKAWGVTEHGMHVRHACRVPAIEGLIKAWGVSEHDSHVRHACRVPAIEGLISDESGGVLIYSYTLIAVLFCTVILEHWIACFY